MSAPVELGLTITRDFTVSDPGYGTLVNADSTPTCEVFEDANDTPILSPTVAQRTALTGHYRVQVACTTANGFEEGKSYNVVITVVVNGVTSKLVLDSFEVVIGVPRGAVVADAGNLATTFKTDRTEATNDHWKDALLVFLTGSLAGQVKKVTAYDGTTKFVTFAAGFTAAPAATDRFILINA